MQLKLFYVICYFVLKSRNKSMLATYVLCGGNLCILQLAKFMAYAEALSS
jgi:hypothetical protein